MQGRIEGEALFAKTTFIFPDKTLYLILLYKTYKARILYLIACWRLPQIMPGQTR